MVFWDYILDNSHNYDYNDDVPTLYFVKGVVKMKKYVALFSLLLVMGLLLSACGGTKGSQGLTFTSNGDGTCAVTGMGTCTDEALVIPSKSPDGDKVTSIADSAFKDSKIRSVELADSVTEIGREAFASCRRLETVDFGDSLVKIGSQAFDYCDLITEIELPDSFQEFGRSVDTEGREYGGSSTFANCTQLTKINIPKNVKAIYSDTFAGTNLTEVTVEAQFPYAILDFVWGDFDVYGNTYGPSAYHPALLAEKPVDDSISYLDPVNVIETSEPITDLLYSLLFGSETVTVNEAALVLPEPSCTPGAYGVRDGDEYNSAFTIVSDTQLNELWWDDLRGEYQLYETYTFSANPTEDYYEFTDSNGYTVGFFTLDKYLFMDGQYGHFELNQGYAG